MPTGVYERSTEQKERLRKMVKIIAPLVPKGTHLSPKTEFGKGAEPWNKGKEWPEMRGENHPSRNPEHRAIFEKIWGQPKTYWSGADHPCWKGGKTPLIMKIRNSQQCADWRVAIFKRDKYTCRVCGDNRGHNLNAHHYRQLADMIHSLGIETFSQAVETPILWDISNGITLCEPCHVMANAASKLVKFLYGGDYERIDTKRE